MSTYATVYAVEENGATGSPVGFGVPVAPRTLVADVALATALAARPPGSLRIGVAGDTIVDVVDVAEIHVLAEAPSPVVVLELVRPTTAVVGHLTPVGESPDVRIRPDTEAGARSVLADLARDLVGSLDLPDPAGIAQLPGGDPYGPESGGIFCHWLHIGCPGPVD